MVMRTLADWKNQGQTWNVSKWGKRSALEILPHLKIKRKLALCPVQYQNRFALFLSNYSSLKKMSVYIWKTTRTEMLTMQDLNDYYVHMYL